MGASRTSNKDILDAINAQTDAITKLASAIAGGIASPASAPVAAEPTPVVTEAAPVSSEPASVQVNRGYMTRMSEKAQAHADKHGETVQLYARRNLSGEVKLAFALDSSFAAKRDRDRQFIGKVGTFHPA